MQDKGSPIPGRWGLFQLLLTAALAVFTGCFYYSGDVRGPRASAGEGASGQGTRLRAVALQASDPVLKEEICSYVFETSRARCEDGRDIPALALTLDVRPSHPELIRSVFLSVATLTTGVFVLRSAPAVIQVQRLPKRAGREPSTLVTQGRIGLYAFLPLYAGLIATAGGGMALKPQEPADFQSRCAGGGDAKACERYRGYIRSVLDFSGSELSRTLQSVLEESHES
ncbi:MAG: hypothetical protein HY042_09765 [Spirochaetia bacterium]|nr:hypothetical protein [Spirochaetia bacterium]